MDWISWDQLAISGITYDDQGQRVSSFPSLEACTLNYNAYCQTYGLHCSYSDSCATSVLVFSMCKLVAQAIKDENQQVIEDCQRITAKDRPWVLQATAEDICNGLFHTAFLGMEKQSSPDTRSRAKGLAERINSHHIDCDLDLVFNAMTKFFSLVMNKTLNFKVHGGSNTENIALQNIQARLRMVISYLFASMLPTVRQRFGGGGLLVLGSANVDERFVAVF